MEKLASDGPKWGQKDFFLLIQTLPIFWVELICILRILIFPMFWDSRFPDFQIPGFPDSQMSRLSAIDSQSILRDGSAVAPRRLRGCSAVLPDHKVQEIQGTTVGHYRENPISASPVWGTRA